MQKARWSTAVAAAALLALPVAASAQSSTQSSPQPNPPAQSQPTSSSQQPPTTSAPPSGSQQPPSTASASSPAPGSGQVDANAAKTHLGEARESLSQLASLPEAAKLQGTARTQVSQLISDFNALITTQAEWRTAYAKVDSDISTLLGPDSDDATANSAAASAGATGTSGTGTTGATGTSGSTSAAGNPGTASPSGGAQIDPAIRSKLVDFRTHLKEFEKAAGGATPNASTAPSGSDTASSSSASTSSGASASGAMPPSAATSATSNPTDPANPTPTGTSGVSAASPTSKMGAPDRERASSAVDAAGNADAQKELDAISAIISQSKTGTLTKAQTTELKTHVENLRALLAHQ